MMKNVLRTRASLRVESGLLSASASPRLDWTGFLRSKKGFSDLDTGVTSCVGT